MHFTTQTGALELTSTIEMVCVKMMYHYIYMHILDKLSSVTKYQSKMLKLKVQWKIMWTMKFQRILSNSPTWNCLRCRSSPSWVKRTILPGTLHPIGTGPPDGNTNLPLWVCCPSFRNMETYEAYIEMYLHWYIYIGSIELYQRGKVENYLLHELNDAQGPASANNNHSKTALIRTLSIYNTWMLLGSYKVRHRVTLTAQQQCYANTVL